MRRGSWLAGVVGLVLVAITPGESGAQNPADLEERFRLELGPVHAGWCLYFLIEPREADDFIPKGSRPLGVGEVDWHPALARSVAGDPEHAGWIPTRLCEVVVEAIQADGATYTKGPRKTLPAFLYWELPIEPANGGTGPARAARLLGVNSKDLAKRLARLKAPVEYVELMAEPLPDSPDWRYELELGRMHLVFDGHPVPDSTLAPEPIRLRWSVGEPRSDPWEVDLALTPEALLAFPGGLRFQGKGYLAEALKASPIRLVSPLFRGGTATLRFLH